MINRRQALRRYDHIPGVISRQGSNQRVFTALVRAAFIDRGHMRQGDFWIVSVWYHPPNIGVSPQHQWCADHGILDPFSGRANGHIGGCLPRGKRPRPLR
jgi:hypothetical protein